MACNCASKEQIEELYRKYGEKKETTKSQTLKFKIKKILRAIGIHFCCIILTPIIFLYVIYVAVATKERKISVMKFFRIDKKEFGSNVG